MYFFTNVIFLIKRWASQVVLMVKHPPTIQELEEMSVQSLGWEDPLEKGIEIYFSICLKELHGQRSLAGYRLQTQKESDTTKVT